MANERMADAVTAFLRGQFNASVNDAHQAVVDGRTDDSTAAVRRASAIDTATQTVREHYLAIDQIHQELGFPIPPIEILTGLAPEVSVPEAKEVAREDSVSVVDESLAKKTGVLPPVTVPIDEPHDDDDDTQLADTEIPVIAPNHAGSKVEQRNPRTVVSSPEQLEIPKREARVIAAAFGLDLTRSDFLNRTHANCVSSAFADVLPPRSDPEKTRKDAFTLAIRDYNAILASVLNDLYAAARNYDSLSEEGKERVMWLNQFLKNLGYPEDASVFELQQLANRREGFDSYSAWRDKKAEERFARAVGSRLVFPPLSEPRARNIPRSAKRIGENTGETGKGRSRKRRMDQSGSSDFSIGRGESGSAEIEMLPQDRMLGEAIFALNEDQTPVSANLVDVAEKVFGNVLARLDGDKRKAAIDRIINTVITRYILDRSQAYASTMNSYRKDNLKIRDRALAREVRYFIDRYNYPNNLSPQEIGLLMSKQLTLPIILGRRNGWRVDHSIAPELSITSVSSGEIEIVRQEDHGEGEDMRERLTPVHEFAHRKDRLTDAQRNYLGIVYKTNGSGEMVYPTRAKAVEALYPVEFAAAIKSGAPKDLGLILAHFGRTGKTLKGMLENALSGGHAPAELRAFINATRNSDAFRDMPDDLFIQFSQR